MEYMKVIRKRRSVRKFKKDPIPKTTIDELIESARLAPSGGNGQDWLFGVITDEEMIKELSLAANDQKWIRSAPLVIALCVSTKWNLRTLSKDDFSLIVNKERFTEKFIGYLQEYDEQTPVSLLFNNSIPLIPGEHIFLTAINNGLHACWVGYLDVKRATTILNLPKDYFCLFLMPIGYKDETIHPKVRKKTEEIVFYNKYDKE